MLCMLCGLLLSTTAFAHVESATGGDGGFLSGLLHPVTGLDHIVAMVAVGLWGAILGMPAIWVLPVAFPLIMAFGAVLGIIGVPLPGIEIGIALSGIVLGLLVMTRRRLPLPVAFVIVSLFALYHGHPHGTALPDFGVPILFATGFVMATGLLHLAGIALGLLYRWPAGRRLIQGSGASIALIGVYYLQLALFMSS